MMKFNFVVTPAEKDLRLDQYLAKVLPSALRQDVSKGKAKRWIEEGGIFLNGKRVRIASKTLRIGAKLQVIINPSEPRQTVFRLAPSAVLYEDEDLIAFNKPPGLPTQATLDRARNNLFAAAQAFLKKRDGETYLGLHHRLDRDTSGVVLMTLSKRANGGIAEAFRERSVQKTYLALCLKDSPLQEKEWVVKNYLKRDRGRKNAYISARSGGDFAETRFRVVSEWSTAALVEAYPKTGRTHQIRVHLAEYGLPVAGDRTYRGYTPAVPRLMLHAQRLELAHPVTGAKIAIEAPIPQDFKTSLEFFSKQG